MRSNDELRRIGAGADGFGEGDSPERRAMNQALTRLGQVEVKHGATVRTPCRLIFGLDLTGSREASLYQARIATAAMFDTIKVIGKIIVKLIYYRGATECQASKWHDDPAVLAQTMRRLSCESGNSQIARLLRAALAETEKVSGMVFIGDHCEEDHGELLALAEALGQKSMPLWMFHECSDHDARAINAKPLFKQMAAASGGVYVEFKPDSGAVLREILSNVAAFSTAGAEGVKRLGQATTAEGRELQGRLLLGPAAAGGVKGSELI